MSKMKLERIYLFFQYDLHLVMVRREAHNGCNACHDTDMNVSNLFVIKH